MRACRHGREGSPGLPAFLRADHGICTQGHPCADFPENRPAHPDSGRSAQTGGTSWSKVGNAHHGRCADRGRHAGCHPSVRQGRQPFYHLLPVCHSGAGPAGLPGRLPESNQKNFRRHFRTQKTHRSSPGGPAGRRLPVAVSGRAAAWNCTTTSLPSSSHSTGR